MESSEHNWANILETICPEMLVLAKQASWMLLFPEYPDKSHNFTNQHLTLTIFHFLPFLHIYNKINQFYNHDAEVYAPQRLVYLWGIEFCSWLRPRAVSRLCARFVRDEIIKSLRSARLLQVILVKVNYNYFTLYKASSLNLKKLILGLAFLSFFGAAYLCDEVTVRGCPLQ